MSQMSAQARRDFVTEHYEDFYQIVKLGTECDAAKRMEKLLKEEHGYNKEYKRSTMLITFRKLFYRLYSIGRPSETFGMTKEGGTADLIPRSEMDLRMEMVMDFIAGKGRVNSFA